MPQDHGKDGNPQDGRSTMDILIVLLLRKRFIAYFVLSATLISVIVSFILPKWYRSSVTLLPPKNQAVLGGIGGLSALIKEVSPTAANKFGAQSSGYNYLAILDSRQAAEAMIRQFKLIEVYDISDGSVEEAIKEFHHNSSVEVGEEGGVVISIFDKDAGRAAQMANYMVQVLNEISIELGTKEARSNREFLQNRVADNKVELRSAEEQLKVFQETHGLVLLTDDVKATASAIGDLYARKVRAEVELSILLKTTGASHLEYKQLQLEKTELEKKLGQFPELGINSFRLYRNVIIQQKIMELLVPLYEQARIEEQKDIPVMLVLDNAVPAEKKSYPKRLLIIVSTLLSSLMIAIGIVLLVSRLEELRWKKTESWEKFVSALGRKKLERAARL